MSDILKEKIKDMVREHNLTPYQVVEYMTTNSNEARDIDKCIRNMLLYGDLIADSDCILKEPR